MRDLALVSVLLPMLAMAVVRPFVGVLVWFWIAFMNPHREVYGFAVSQPWAMLAFLATVVGCFVAREPKRPAVNAVTVVLVLFAAVITVTSAMAIAPASSVWPKWERTIKTIMGLLLAASLLTERRRVDALVWLMVISMGYFGVKGGIFTLMTGGGFIVLGPPDTMIEDRNHLATALLISLPLMNYLRMHARHRLVRIGLPVAMATTLFAVVGSQSRGALLGLAATAGMLWLRSKGKIVSGLAIAAGVAGAIAFMPDSWVERMNTMNAYQEDGSAMGRILIWQTTLAIAAARPLTGGGFTAFYFQDIVDRFTPGTDARAAHSIWFEVIGEHGWLGFAVWLCILGAGFWYSLRVARLAKDRPGLEWAGDLARMSQVAMVAYAAGGTFLSLSYWDFFWALMVLQPALHALVMQAATAPVAARGAAVPAGRLGWRDRGATVPAPRLPAP